MSIFKYLQEQLIAEKLPLATARHYVKKGRENIQTLPDEFKEAYDKMFGTKSRIQIGTIRVETSDMLKRDITRELRELNNFIRTNQNPDIPEGTSNIALDVLLTGFDDENPNYVVLDINSNEAKQELIRAYDKTKSAYLLKTVIKILKKYVAKDKQNDLSNMAGKILTQSSNISTVEEAPVVLSRHPYDVAGMSTAKRWRSCKDTVSGCNRHYLDTEVGHLLIAYIVNPARKGKDLLNDPYARLLVLPVEGDDGYGLFVSPDVYKYGGHFYEFHDIVEDYVSNFMKTYSDEDEKTTVGDYYEDSGFGNEDARRERVEDAIRDMLRRINYSPNSFDDDMMEYITTKVFENGEDVEDVVSDTIINEFYKLFKALNNIDHTLPLEFYDEYIGKDFPNVLNIVDQYSIEDIVSEYLVHSYTMMTPDMLYRAVADDIITDVFAYVQDIISNEGSSIYENFLVSFVKYIIDTDNDVDVYKTDANGFFNEISYEDLWDKINGDISPDEYYAFGRKMKLSDEDILEVLDVSDMEEYDALKSAWDSKDSNE